MFATRATRQGSVCYSGLGEHGQKANGGASPPPSAFGRNPWFHVRRVCRAFFVLRRATFIAPRLSKRGSALAKSGQRAGSASQVLQHLYSACRPAPPFPWPSEPVPKKHHGAAALSVALSGHRHSFTGRASPCSSAWEEPRSALPQMRDEKTLSLPPRASLTAPLGLPRGREDYHASRSGPESCPSPWGSRGSAKIIAPHVWRGAKREVG